MKRQLLTFAWIIWMGLGLIGCGEVVGVMVEGVVGGLIESSLDRALETKEKRHIRKDFERYEKKQKLKHHDNYRELRKHDSSLREDDWYQESWHDLIWKYDKKTDKYYRK